MYDTQFNRMPEYVLPKTVYRQAVWAAKDYRRMENRLKILETSEYYSSTGATAAPVSAITGFISDKTAERAVEAANLSHRMKQIDMAFTYIPERYRNGIREKLYDDVPYSESHHINTWKKWQQIFIYYVARNLNLL